MVMVGRLERAKAIDLGLRAFSSFRQAYPGARLTILGDGPDLDELKALALELGLGPSAEFLGWRDDAPAWIAAADLCLIPSRAEGQSIVALEAMALGTPVVASACTRCHSRKRFTVEWE